MQEKTLLKIALAVGVVGLAVLFFISQSISIDEAMLNRLDGMVDETVVITGVVLDVSTFGSVTSVMIEKNELTSVVLFGDAPLLETGDLVQVRGKVVENEGETELIGEEIRVI
ncbi:hypothetical protein ACFL3V_01155 [Nanoarchaeota archaeon]